jgi:CelD/BcsL family acetyltransferase involved in cellulose biosynthesis/GNAT superfamily N-acetyltransferase/uncharacterized protein YfkK (UPF0435 family)
MARRNFAFSAAEENFVMQEDLVVEIISEQSDVNKQLADVCFRRQWTNLQNECPWATSMQSLTFVEPWYEVYASQYKPVLVMARDKENKLVGLLPLAVETSSSKLVVAGDYLCEYGTWLATAADNDRFITKALDALAEKFPNSVLQFVFLAADTPIEWLKENDYWNSRSVLRKMNRPLLRLDDSSELQAILDKKKNRTRLKQMGRAGTIEFVQVTDVKEFEAIFDQVTTFGDLRLSAVHRVTPKADPNKKKFYIALFKADLLHVTLLKVGGKIASAHFNTYNRDQVLLGVTALSPFFAKHSPSKFHITMLGLELFKLGVKACDLTPGGGYKDGHANSHDEVHLLTIYFNRAARRKFALRQQLADTSKKVLKLANVNQENLIERLYDIQHKLKFVNAGNVVPKLAAKARKLNEKKREMRVYTFDLEKIASLPNPNLMNRDCLEYLLKYEPTESRDLTVSAFHRVSTERLSEGNHVYTKVEAGKLVHYGWLIEKQEKSFISEINQYFTMPPDSAVMFDFYTHPQARGKGFYQASMRQILHEASRIPNLREIYISVLADNGASRHAIEKIGFEYKCSLFG